MEVYDKCSFELSYKSKSKYCCVYWKLVAVNYYGHFILRHSNHDRYFSFSRFNCYSRFWDWTNMFFFFLILTPHLYAAFERPVVTAITSCRIIMFTGREITTSRRLDWNKERLFSIITSYPSANISLIILETNLPDTRSLLKNDKCLSVIQLPIGSIQ